jgi:hypothetical protein
MRGSSIQIGAAIFIIFTVLMLCGMVLPGLASGQSDDVQKGLLLYSDNFSTSKFGIGWSGESPGNNSIYYKDGKYYIQVYKLNSWKTISEALSGGNFSDFILEVEATEVDGPDDNEYGVIFRKLDWDNYYMFRISGDGYYKFSKNVNKKWTSDTWMKSSAINTGKATNLIGVVCQGDKIGLYINGVKVKDLTDSSNPFGTIGIVAGNTYGGKNTTVCFDNINVWALKES